MCDFLDSSQLNIWLYNSPDVLDECRARANYLARQAISKPASEEGPASNSSGPSSSILPVQSFAGGFTSSSFETEDYTAGPWSNSKNSAYLTPEEEALLVAFYASKLPSLIGPLAQIPRLRRESKVTATAALLFRRFYLSNSVMIHDPKALMVAAAFLGCKIEDATADVRYLEEGTNLMNAPVSQAEILPAELALLSGIQFHLLCFHPYKAVVAFTEDLRTFLKTVKGRQNVLFPANVTTISGQDLQPLYDGARAVLDDVIVSDIPLLYTPGQIGLAALIVANEDLQRKYQSQEDKNKKSTPPPNIDMLQYVRQRFAGSGGGSANAPKPDMEKTMKNLVLMLRGLRKGEYGCGNHQVDMATLKSVHKKLKKCRAWGKEKKKKKRSAEGSEETESKKQKTS